LQDDLARVQRAPPNFTVIPAYAAWRQADSILQNEAKVVGSKPRLHKLDIKASDTLCFDA
jgi:hypothetical protein